MESDQAFFASARDFTGCLPERVTTDGHAAYPTIAEVLKTDVKHRPLATASPTVSNKLIVGSNSTTTRC